ncbi:MAG: DUF5717 family protein [Lachnospiraceae bacterium]|nr:DUF5717 family protein [Lachnospiraceae bacterium]
MNNRMEELLSGTYEMSRPELITSVSELRLQIQEGKKYKGSVSLGTSDGSRMRGLVTSDNHRILLAGNSISGNSCTILFGVDTKGLKEGDLISGTIVISSNLSEKRIPVKAEIIAETVQASEGAIRSLEDFTRLCMKSYREGFRLFASNSFAGLLRGKNRAFLPLYKGLSHAPVTYQHMEEFLISIEKKKPVLFSLDKQEKEVYHLDASQKDTLYIYKNNWGYVRIEVELTGTFLQVEKRVITSEDFIGKVFGLEYIVNRERLHQGRNYGTIRLKSVYQELEFRIEASAGALKEVAGLRENRIRAAIARDMLDLQMRRIDYRTWQQRGRQLVTDLKNLDPENSAAILYDAYLCYSEDNLQRMNMLLGLFQKGSRTLKSKEEETWYLYLSKLAGIRSRETQNFLMKVRRNHELEPDQYLYLHLLLQEDPSYEHMSARIMFELEQCYEQGCNSPFLYLKAWKMLNEQESLLRRLTPFYLQVLRFAAVRGQLSESLYRRMTFLAGSIREFSEPVYQLLASGYKKYQSVDILEAICKQIMKGQAYKKEYFVWYALAVEKELRITRLYEYYMETIPREMADRIPRQIRMYFTYNNTLGERRRALLYSSVLLHKDKDRTCYMNYQTAIRTFAEASLKKGRISEEFAVLYQALLQHPDSVETAAALTNVLFCHKVEVKDASIRYVIVCHHALRAERKYPCRDGAAYVDLYSEDACILFEDEKRRRFASTVEYSCRPLMEIRDIAARCIALGVEHTGLQLYCCGEKSRQLKVSQRILACCRMAEANEDFTDSFRGKIRQKLLDFYMDNLEDERLLISVLTGDMREYAAVDKVSTAVLLIEAGLYERAFQLVSEFGYERIPDSLLLRLASRMILKMEFQEDEDLLCLSEYVFRQGKYDEIMLTYLLEFSMGSIEYLCELWKRVKGFHLEPLKLEKRILVLAVLTGRMPSEPELILESYILNQGQESVITSFLTWVSGGWIYQDIEIPDLIFLYLEKLLGNRWELNLLCRLALLKYYSKQESLGGEQLKEAEKILTLCREKKLTFAFFKRLPKELIRPLQLEEKLFVEERFLPGTRVIIHYALGHREEAEEAPVWKSEPLPEMIPGIFSREFLLFYGEVLTYYLTYRNGEEELKVGERKLALTELDTDGGSRYKILNRILTARATGSLERMNTAIEDYLWQDAFTEYFCRIM